MRNNLLATVAAAALAAGMSLAAAQSGMQNQKDLQSDTPKSMQTDTQKSEPQKSDKSAPAPKSVQSPGSADTKSQTQVTPPSSPSSPQTGQTQQPSSSQKGMTQSDQPASTTPQRPGSMGQTPSDQAKSTQSSSLSVQLSPQQRTEIRQKVLVGPSVPRASNVDFTIRVGTRVPREKVQLVAVPDELIRINPRFRGLEYIVIGDQIVIIDPRTLEIVAILDV